MALGLNAPDINNTLKPAYSAQRLVDLHSLGTGELSLRLPYEETRTWGLAKWAQPILAVVFDGVSDAVHSQLQLFVPEEKCYRIQSKLIGVDERMDNARLSNIAALKVLDDNIIHGNDKLIDGLYGLLSQ